MQNVSTAFLASLSTAKKEYFEQIDGVPMGGKASNLFADVIMNYITDKAMEITPLQYKPFVLYRYVDGCFSVFNDKKIGY